MKDPFPSITKDDQEYEYVPASQSWTVASYEADTITDSPSNLQGDGLTQRREPAFQPQIEFALMSYVCLFCMNVSSSVWSLRRSIA